MLCIVFKCREAIYSSVTTLQSPTMIKLENPSGGLHCVKNVEIRAFHDLYFPVYGRNRNRIFPYLVRFSDSVQIRENTNLTLSIYGKVRIRKSPCFGIFMHCFSVPKFYKWFDLKAQTFKVHWEISPSFCYYTPTVRDNNRKYQNISLKVQRSYLIKQL